MESDVDLLEISKRKKILEKAGYLESISVRSLTEKDEAAIYAESWAVSYRKLSEEQKLFAKKAIDEILILGQLNQLSLNSVKSTTMNPLYSSPSVSTYSLPPTFSQTSSFPIGYSPTTPAPETVLYISPISPPQCEHADVVTS